MPVPPEFLFFGDCHRPVYILWFDGTIIIFFKTIYRSMPNKRQNYIPTSRCKAGITLQMPLNLVHVNL